LATAEYELRCCKAEAEGLKMKNDLLLIENSCLRAQVQEIKEEKLRSMKSWLALNMSMCVINKQLSDENKAMAEQIRAVRGCT
jgi:hypothetical protein